jgi:ABC-type lipoprotein release transport system permease subunit
MVVADSTREEGELCGIVIGVGVSLLAIHKLAFTIYNGGAQQNLALQFVPDSLTLALSVGYVLVLSALSSILPCFRALTAPIPTGLSQQ